MSQKVFLALPSGAASAASEPKAPCGIDSQLRRAAIKVAQAFLPAVSQVFNLLEVTVSGRQALPTRMSAIQQTRMSALRVLRIARWIWSNSLIPCPVDLW